MSQQAEPIDLLHDSTTDIHRCWWCGTDADYVKYHDDEWGLPIADDRLLFEKLCLEGFQAGLSWLTILRKRQAFRAAFDNFEVEKVAKFNQRRVEKLLQDAGIVRHRGKIESTINNARKALEIRERDGSLAAFVWRYQPSQTTILHTRAEIVPQTKESKALSKELKRQGWSFVGPTTCYAFMQAMGMVNDHLQGCHRWKEIERARQAFTPPT